MGLDAFVRCNCFELGLTSAPPIPREELFIDEEGYISSTKASSAWPTMSFDEYSNEFGEVDDRIREWEENCCVHPEMDYCSEWMGNWYAVRFFEGLVEQLGNEEFPVLSTIIPEGNGGIFPAKKAQAALEELECFLSRVSEMHQVSLIDVHTGDRAYSYIAVWGGVFMYAFNQQVGLDENGLFVIELPSGREVFRSRHMSQSIIDEEKRARLICLESGTECDIFSAIGVDKVNREMKLEILPVQDYQLTTAHALKRLLQASLETGNPIQWC
jgi:hypothetical protein